MAAAYSSGLNGVKSHALELNLGGARVLIHPMATPSKTSVKAIAERLRVTRLALGLSQAAFCRRAGLQPNTYNQWEKALGRPELDKGLLMCEEFGLTLDWIYRGDRSGLPHQLAMDIETVISGEQTPKRSARPFSAA